MLTNYKGKFKMTKYRKTLFVLLCLLALGYAYSAFTGV